MDDVSMMSVDGNMSFDVRDPGRNGAPIIAEITGLDSGPTTETGQLDINIVAAEEKGGNSVSCQNEQVGLGRKTFTVDDTAATVGPIELKERTSVGSSNRSITPTPGTDDTGKSPQPSEPHSVPESADSPSAAPKSTTPQGSASGSRLNGTFDKTPNKSNSDPLSGGDGLDVAFSSPGQVTPESKLNGTFDKDKSSLDIKLPECPAEDCADTCSPRKLNDTFDKSPSEPSQHNGTFDKETSTIFVGDLTKTPELELRLDNTCQTDKTLDRTRDTTRGEQQDKATPDAKALLSTPDKGELASRIQSTPRLARRKTSACGDNAARAEAKIKEDDEKDEIAKSHGQRRSSGGSFLKRRCSILELSFVSSPKRANYQPNTPKGVPEGGRLAPIMNLHESIAFDFSAAAATAQKNNGVAEMGSFVFAASSGQPIAADVFDLSALEKIDTSSKTNGEKYTRVSFIAMFDPIKPSSPTQDKLEGKTGAECPEHSTDSIDFKTPTARTGSHFTMSPLVKGLPTPMFAKPKAYIAVAVQTEPVQEAKPDTSEPQTPKIDHDEMTARITDLNRMVENQQNALNCYEKIVVFLKNRMVDARNDDELAKKPDSEEVSRLKESLAAERDRNAQQDDVVRNLERSMHSTLKRMAECRESNAALTKVVEEQLAAMSLTRANCEALEVHTNEVLSNAEDEVRVLKEKAQEDERSHKKAINMLDLQLKAKESELEYSQSQLAIAKKEIDSLRELVKQMNLQ